MAAGIETLIWLAIKSRVVTLPVSYARRWPGETAAPPHSGGSLLPYLRIATVSAAPQRRLIADGMPHWRTGFLMVTLVYPLGQDVAVYTDIAAQIAAHFNDTVKMRSGNVCVSVARRPHVMDGYEQDGYWNVPVRIPWRCFA